MVMEAAGTKAASICKSKATSKLSGVLACLAPDSITTRTEGGVPSPINSK
jgi:hypothetical protein